MLKIAAGIPLVYSVGISIRKPNKIVVTDFGAMNRLQFASILRPVTTRLPRGGWRINALIMGNRPNSEQDELYRALIPPENRLRTFRDRFTGCNVVVDITDWAGRAHYLNARYYDRDVPRVAAAILKKGDVFIDVGANRGLHTIAVAKTLGPDSEIYAIEPNPEMVEVINMHLQMNELEWCRVLHCGVGDKEETLQLLRFQDKHSGGYSFLPHKKVEDTLTVEVKTLDCLFEKLDFDVHTLIKLDIEGYEYNALQGMKTILECGNTAIYSEISPTLLKNAGASEADIFQLLYSKGYSSYLVKTKRDLLGHEEIRFYPFRGPRKQARQYNAFFSKVPPDNSLLL